MSWRTSTRGALWVVSWRLMRHIADACRHRRTSFRCARWLTERLAAAWGLERGA